MLTSKLNSNKPKLKRHTFMCHLLFVLCHMSPLDTGEIYQIPVMKNLVL